MISLSEIPPYIWAGLFLFFCAGLYFGQLISYYIQKKYTKEKIKLAIDMWSSQTYLYQKHNTEHLRFMSKAMGWFAKFTSVQAEYVKHHSPYVDMIPLYEELDDIMKYYYADVEPMHDEWDQFDIFQLTKQTHKIFGYCPEYKVKNIEENNRPTFNS